MTKWYHRDGSQYTGEIKGYRTKAKDSAYYTQWQSCPRCGGTGHYSYCQMYGTICFECNNGPRRLKYKLRRVPVWTADKLAKMDRIKAKRDAVKAEQLAVERARHEADMQAKRDQFVKDHADLLAKMDRAIPDAQRLWGDDHPLVTMRRDIVSRARVTDKQVGYIRSLVDRVQQAVERESRDRASEWIGEIKERFDIEVTVDKVLQFSAPSFTGYGTSWVYITLMHDKDGNKLVNKGRHLDLDEGDCALVRGTVKAHDEYKGTKQTVLTRVQVKEVMETA